MFNPTICQWDLIPDCNLNCKHCRIHLMEYERLKHHQLTVLADKIATSSIKTLAIAGGEPLIYPEIEDILSRFTEMENLIILTNGTLIDENKVSILKRFNCKVQISLDGGTEQTHDACRGEGSFEKTIRGIKLLQNCDIPLWTRFTITPINKHEVSIFVNLSKDLGVKRCSIRRCIPVGNASNFSRLTAEEIRLAFEKAYSEGNRVGVKIVSPDSFAAISYNPEKRGQYERLMKEYPSVCVGGCKSGITSLYVDPAGKVLFCPYAPIVCGDLFDEKIDEIWEKSKVLRYAREIRHNLDGKCSSCRYLMSCGGCPAASYATTGSLLHSDQDCWL